MNTPSVHRTATQINKQFAYESDPPIIVSDGRADLPVFIHSDLDDLGLTPEAFRVYCHLARRAGRDGDAHPGYTSIGEICFRSRYPRANAGTLTRKAIAAAKELETHGLIVRVARSRADGGRAPNQYILTPRDRWQAGGGRVSPHGGGCHRMGEGVTAPKDHPKFEDHPKDEEEEIPPSPPNLGGTDQQQQPALKVGGEKQKPVTPQPAPALEFPNSLPEAIARRWVQVFGELTTEQAKFLSNRLRKDGDTEDAILIALDKVPATATIEQPAAYVKKILSRGAVAQHAAWTATTPTAASLTPALPTEAATPTQTHATDIASTWAAILRGEPCGNAPGLDPAARQLLAGTSVTNGKWEGDRPILTVHGIFAAYEREIRHILRTGVCNLWFEHCQQSAMWEVSPW